MNEIDEHGCEKWGMAQMNETMYSDEKCQHRMLTPLATCRCLGSFAKRRRINQNAGSAIAQERNFPAVRVV